jgi:hypothetical protein
MSLLMSWAPREGWQIHSGLCLHCGVRPRRDPLVDERGEECTIGLLTCQECSGDKHAWGCNDPHPHEPLIQCSRRSWR